MEGQDVPAYGLVAGAPAKVKRQFDGPQPGLAWAAEEYVRLGQTYQTDSEILSEVDHG